MPLYDRILSVFARLARDRHASIAPTFALLLLPLLGLMGMAIDVSSMLAERTRLQNISDAAAINFARVMLDRIQSCGTTQACVNDAVYLAQLSTNQFYPGLVGDDKSLAAALATGYSNGSYSNTAGTISAEIHTTFVYTPIFMQLFNIPPINLVVNSFVSQAVPKYTQVIFLVDVSGSMGVAATTTDLTNLENMIYSVSGGSMQNCAFACHQYAAPSWIWSPNYYKADFRTLARTGGPGGSQIMLKIDYAQNAVSDFTTKLSNLNTQNPGYLTSGIYTFSGTLNTVQSPTQNFSLVANAVPNIDLDLYQGDGSVPYYGGTSLTSVLTEMESKFTNVGLGDGSSPTNQLTYLILVTDGVEDTLVSGYPDGHKTDTTWTSVCTAIKNMNINIATVQAQYVQFPQDQTYLDLVAPIYNQITPAMQSCASSAANALSASDGPGIQSAIDTLFNNLFVNAPRLTQ